MKKLLTLGAAVAFSIAMMNLQIVKSPLGFTVVKGGAASAADLPPPPPPPPYVGKGKAPVVGKGKAPIVARG
jgi:hypothetical protein